MSLPIGQYVELLPDCENVYQKAWAASRAWIRDKKVDDYGFAKVYVEWDKHHWRYQGEPDGWTYETHFRAVDDEVEDLMAHNAESQMDMDHEMIDGYIESITSGFDLAAESDGFYLITFRRTFDPELGMEVIVVDTHRGSVHEDLQLLAEADLLRFVEEAKRRRGDFEE